MATKAQAKRGEGARAPRREYQSPLRAQRAEQTRSALIDAATRLFSTKGWAATGMRDIATEAGVATETVYAYFSSKRLLLQAVIDIAVVGDERALAVADRPEFIDLGRGSRSDRIAAAARLIAAIHERTAVFAHVLREAAPSHAEIAEMLRATRERQRRDVESGAALIMDRKPTPKERDGFWAVLSPEVYLLLVDQSGWRVDEYEQWVAETLERVVPRS